MTTDTSAPSRPATRGRHAVVAAFVTMTSTVVVVAASLAYASEISGGVPARWGLDGAAGEPMSLWTLTLLVGALVAGEGILLGVISHRVGPAVAQRSVGGVAVGLPMAMAALHVGIVRAAAEAGPSTAFPSTAGWVALAVLVAGTLAGAAIVVPTEHHSAVIAADVLEVAPGEAIVWTGRTTAPAWLWGLLAGTAVIVTVLMWPVQPVLAVAVLALLGVSGGVLVARVAVGPGGLTTRLGPFGLIRFHVPLDQITDVDAIEIDPLAFGGWGLRILPGVRGIVFSAGPGLRVEQRDGPMVVVTVDDAAQAAGVLRAHLQSGRPTS